MAARHNHFGCIQNNGRFLRIVPVVGLAFCVLQLYVADILLSIVNVAEHSYYIALREAQTQISTEGEATAPEFRSNDNFAGLYSNWIVTSCMLFPLPPIHIRMYQYWRTINKGHNAEAEGKVCGGLCAPVLAIFRANVSSCVVRCHCCLFVLVSHLQLISPYLIIVLFVRAICTPVRCSLYAVDGV